MFKDRRPEGEAERECVIREVRTTEAKDPESYWKLLDGAGPIGLRRQLVSQ